MAKKVEVETVDLSLFQAVMSFVVKDSSGSYRIALKDLCKLLSIEVKAVNDMLNLSYAGMRRYEIPHLELSVMDRANEGYYILSGGQYEYSEDDVFCVTAESVYALPYALLDLIRDQNTPTSFNERFACILGMTVEDCLKYAPECENSEE